MNNVYTVSAREKVYYRRKIAKARRYAKQVDMLSHQSEFKKVANAYAQVHRYIHERNAGVDQGTFERHFMTNAEENKNIEPSTILNSMITDVKIYDENVRQVLEKEFLKATKKRTKTVMSNTEIVNLQIKENEAYLKKDEDLEPVEYSFDTIEQTARNFKKRTGRAPLLNGGLVVDLPLANGTLKWHNINNDIKGNKRGLPKNTFTGLDDFLTKTDIKQKNITIEQILDSYRKTFLKTGKRSNKRGGTILYGSLANGRRTWKAVDHALNQGAKGLKNCPHKSLASLFNAHIGQETDVISINDIIESAYKTLEATGKRPYSESGEILHGPLKGRDLSWSATDQRLFNQGSVEKSEHRSLSKLLNAYGIPRRLPENYIYKPNDYALSQSTPQP